MLKDDWLNVISLPGLLNQSTYETQVLLPLNLTHIELIGIFFCWGEIPDWHRFGLVNLEQA